jgi:chemotaxis protein methyltransferase CheR
MNLSIQVDADNIKHVSVRGECVLKKEADSLIKVMQESNFTGISVTFTDANIIHRDLVNELSTMQGLKNFKVYVLKRNLFSYLHSIGIKCRYIFEKSLLRREACSKDLAMPVDLAVIKHFLSNINAIYGYDYSAYEIQSVVRRIKVAMLRGNFLTFNEFEKAVLEDVDVFENLFLDLSINTTEFFRDPEVFRIVRNRILPYLASYNHIKIWCVGCSNGKEAYSLAILLKELGLLDKTQIYATDINPYIIEEAKNGIYSINTIESDIINYRRSGGKSNFVDYFHLKESYMEIRDDLRSNILFFQHSLIGSGSLNEFSLILCRNVMIYFNPQLQKRVLENFYNSLDRCGFLVLGRSEGLLLNGGEKYFESYMDKEKIYKMAKWERNCVQL